jgi:membrane protein implicated in regulation of membrane protease activity
MEFVALFDNHATLFLSAAFIMLVIELFVLGLAGPLLFVAIGTGLTALLIYLNVITGITAELFTASVLASITALVLWKPLKNFQNSGDNKNTSSDMVGKTVVVMETITKTAGSIRFSGLDWQARLAQSSSLSEIAVDESVVISSVEGTLIIVGD